MNAHLIVPCYNESATLPKSFLIINTLLSETSKDLHGVLFVNDGSMDATQQILENQKKSLPLILRVQNSILHLEINRGKAAAVVAGMEQLKQEGKIKDSDVLFLFDGDIVEPIPKNIITDIKELFFQNPELMMVIIGAEEGYATDEIMIEASGQRALRFGPAYNALKVALEQDKTLGYGIEGLFNQVFEGHTQIYRDVVISTKPPYRANNLQNSAIQQAKDLAKAQNISKHLKMQDIL